jgi:hypothetical protein
MIISGDSLEKQVDHFTSATQAVLRFPYNGTLAVTTNVGYQIYQDEYPAPISPGRDLMIVNPIRQRRIKRSGRYAQEDRFAFARYSQGTYPRVYADAGTDLNVASPTYGQPLLKFWPPPFSAQDLCLLYYKNFAPLLLDNDVSVLPAEFEECLILNAKFSSARSRPPPLNTTT